jgi:hypothetical protein
MRRVMVGLVVVAAVALVVVAVQGGSRPEGSGPGASTTAASTATLPPPSSGTEPAPADPPAVVAGSGPTTVIDGVAMGYSPDAAGAEAAAREFVRASGALVAMAPAEAVAAQRVMAAAAIEEDLVVSRSAELENIWGSTGNGDVSYWFTPIASRASLTDPGEALAEVWYMGVLRSPLTPGMQWWRTATYELVWEDEDWRIARESEIAGPIPTLPSGETPTSAAEMDALLEGFDPRG